MQNDLTEKRKLNGETAAPSSSGRPPRPNNPAQQSEDIETFVHSLAEEYGLKFRAVCKQMEHENQAEADARVAKVDALRKALVDEEDAKKRAELSDELAAEVQRFAQSMNALLLKTKAEISNLEEEMKKVSSFRLDAQRSTVGWLQKAYELPRSFAASPQYEQPGEKADRKAALLKSKQEDQRLAEIFGTLDPPTVRAPPVPKRPPTEGTPSTDAKPLVLVWID